MDGKAKIGVVIFSMGRIVKQSFAPLWFTNVFREAFKEFPDYQFIWKIDSSDYSEKNIHFRQWIPQVSLLADNRTKAFVSHAGPNSIIESTYFGVPMVLIPMFWDQNWHASAAEEKGYAIKLDKFTLTKEILVNALETVLCPSGNSTCRFMIHQKKWVMTSGGWSVFLYYNFDVYAVIAISVTTVVALFTKFAFWMNRKIRKTREKLTKID